MIKSCKPRIFAKSVCVTLASNNGPGQDDSDGIYDIASFADACGAYAMTVTSGGIVARAYSLSKT